MLTHPRSQSGFSLIELALGLVIVATLMSALLVPLATQIDQRRTTETDRLLEQAREAVLGFAVGRGRLPCPATATSNGQESFSDAATGVCTTHRGFLPAVTLGLSPVDGAGFQTDAFGGDINRFRYAVSEAIKPSTGNRLYTVNNGIRGTDATIQIATSGTGNLRVCSLESDQPNTCNGTGNVTLANDNVVAVIFSVGKTASIRNPSIAEAENTDTALPANADNRVFVSQPYNERAGFEFDDQLIWISTNVLISRLASAGQL